MSEPGAVTNLLEAESYMAEEKPHHLTYLRDFRTKQCPEFLQHKCTQHRPFTCFNWHFANQKRRRPARRKEGTFNYSSDVYCLKYDETTGICPDGDECLLLHRTAGDTERRYHLRYYKTCPCVYETDAKGNCSKNGPHCAFAHGPDDLRKPIYDIRELEAEQSNGGPTAILTSPLGASLETDRMLNEDPVWNDPKHVLLNYKTEVCHRPLRLCRQGYACPSYHNPRDKRRTPSVFKYRSTPCPNVKQGDEWGDPSKCENGDHCSYCHTRTEQQFHFEIYKSTKCNDMVQTGYCPRGLFCAFAHTEPEMNMQWETCVGGIGDGTLAHLIDSALSPRLINGRKDDDDDTRLAIGEERTRRNTMPSMQTNRELFVKTNHNLGPGGVNDGFSTSNMLSPQRRTSLLAGDPVANEALLHSPQSSSMNDGFLMSHFLRSAGQCAPDLDQQMRPGSQSVGSYQQYQQYREQLAKLAATNINSNPAVVAAANAVGGYPHGSVMAHPIQIPSVPQNQHQMYGANTNGNIAQPLPSSFFTPNAAPLMMNNTPAVSTGIPLPPSFYANGGAVSAGLTRNAVADDDLDLDLAELKLEPLEEDGADANVRPIQGTVALTQISVTASTHIDQTSTFASPQHTVQRPIPEASVLMSVQQPAMMRMQGPPPGLGPATPPGLGAVGTGQHRAFFANASVDDVIRLQRELAEKKQALMKWEEGMRQAAVACQAWKSEAEHQERMLRQMQEERDNSFLRRDDAMAQVVELRRELDFMTGSVDVGGNQLAGMRALPPETDLQHAPLTTVQQLHTNIQHYLEFIEQVMRNRGICLVCHDRCATICGSPCGHTVLCYSCASKTADCPLCGIRILHHVAAPSVHPQQSQQQTM